MSTYLRRILLVDDVMRNALCMAAKRGVDVRIVTPGTPDKPTIFRLTRSNYPPLLRAGIRIYEYTPGFIHAKAISVMMNSVSWAV